MRSVALILLFLFAAPAFPQQAQTPPAELERVEQTLQTLTDLKAKVVVIQSQIDQLIAELSEQKGAVQNRKPAAFGGIAEFSGAGPGDPARPKAVRCAAMTSKGERCTRSTVPGSRYCRQHQVAHQR
jgi:hypothetical protein